MLWDPFYPILDSDRWLERLLPLGVRMVQIRIKNADQRQLRDMLSRSRDLCREAGCRLVVNDYWELAIELGCSAVHLGQEDLDVADIAAISEAGLALGISTHSSEELDRALSCNPDYIALGPIYPTRLKKMPWGPQGLERITQWKARIGTIPLVAIGGLNPERAPGVFQAGADIVSMVTDITLDPRPQRRVQQWIALTAPHRRNSCNTLP